MASWDWGGSGKAQLKEGISHSVNADFGLGGKLSVGAARSAWGKGAHSGEGARRQGPRAEVSRWWPMGQIQPTSCFCIACVLRTAFTFLNG